MLEDTLLAGKSYLPGSVRHRGLVRTMEARSATSARFGDAGGSMFAFPVEPISKHPAILRHFLRRLS